MVRAPEFDVAEAEEQCGELLWSLCSRLDGSAQQAEWPFLRDILLWLYEKFPRKRAELRGVIGRPLKSAARFVHKSAPLAPLMQVLGPIIRGFQLPLGEAQRRLLLETLLPLHKSNEWLCWDRQTPIVSMYHKELVHCMLLILEKEPRLSCKCLEAVCNYLPQSHESNTPKEVLLIAELAEITKVMQPEDLQGTMPLLVRHMVRLFTSQNAQTLQSVLQFWKDERVSQLLSHFADQLIPNLMPMLLRDGELFWNPTVNKMTSLVLEKLEEADPEVLTPCDILRWAGIWTQKNACQDKVKVYSGHHSCCDMGGQGLLKPTSQCFGQFLTLGRQHTICSAIDLPDDILKFLKHFDS
ncbi:unnamed protein product [Cladocopium goreaui]|uniref:Uncharacterized protein n=1 Tax=Cladocopium goreaui TaxID=2562237 RepID=A0A9P1BLJ7_9DINO|nr:unnamed protein product [Cladocopium goreaui]